MLVVSLIVFSVIIFYGYMVSIASPQNNAAQSSRNDPLTLLITLPQHGLRQPSHLSRLMSGSKTATAACHVAAPRLAAGAAHARLERRAARPTD